MLALSVQFCPGWEVLHENLEYFNERVVRTERGASAHFFVYVHDP